MSAVLAAVALVFSASLGPRRASATSWTTTVVAPNNGEARARALPSAPSNPAAACVSSGTKTIRVTWTTVAGATTYLVYQATSSVGGTYTVTSGGAYAGTTWTSASLANGNYWYEVAALVGTNWIGTRSAATGETTIQANTTKCVQP